MIKNLFLKNIRRNKKGFKILDIDNTLKIGPFELKEIMDEMNMKDKIHVLYSLISSKCTER